MKCMMLMCLVVALICAGCGQNPEDVAAPPSQPPQPRVFAFTNTAEVATAEEIGEVLPARSVKADFNLDGLQDLAVVEEGIEEGETQVTIYIRRAVTEGGVSELVSYYRGGWIQSATDGDIIGVMSSRRQQYTDLILLVARPDGPNAMVHFHSDGSSFSLVGEK